MSILRDVAEHRGWTPTQMVEDMTILQIWVIWCAQSRPGETALRKAYDRLNRNRAKQGLPPLAFTTDVGTPCTAADLTSRVNKIRREHGLDPLIERKNRRPR